MKLELCVYSGYKIYPGHGKRAVKSDGRLLMFLNGKCQRGQDMKRNPREITWTVLYRRKHKKGANEQTVKKRVRRAQKYDKPIAGTTLSELIAKRTQKPEVRKAQREQAIRVAKERTKQKETEKRAKKQAEKQASQKSTVAAQKAQQKATTGKQSARGRPTTGVPR